MHHTLSHAAGKLMVNKSTGIAPIASLGREVSAGAMIHGDNSMSLALPNHEPSQRSPRSITRPSLLVALYLALGALTLSPLLWVRVPPLVDFPSHLARMWILVHSVEIPALASNYIVHWRLLPDLAMDLIVPVLSMVIPVEQAGRVFIALTMLALIGGTAALHRAIHGRVGIWPIWSVLFVYNAELFWGFPTLFASSVYLFAFAGWIASRHWRVGPRIVSFTAVATVLCLLHLFAFGLYALSVVSYEFANRADLRRVSSRSIVGWSAVCLQFSPGLLIWYASMQPGRISVTSYDNLIFEKFYALLAPFIFGLVPASFDLLFVLFILSFLAIAIVTGSLKLAPEMRLPLAVMTAVSLLMPSVVSGSSFVNIRLPVMLPFVIIASTRLEPLRKGVILPIAAVALTLWGVRIWTISQVWHDYDRWFAEFRGASTAIAPGARVLVVAAPPTEPRKLPGIPESLAVLQWRLFHHMPSLAVIDRAAFLPSVFTGWKTLEVTPRNRQISQLGGSVPITPELLVEILDPERARTLNDVSNSPIEPPYWRNWPQTFDFVLWIDFGDAPKPELKELQPVARGSFFEIYRVVRS
jgi:hypothetical protein